MGLFSRGSDNRTNNKASAMITNEEGTRELQAYVNSNIASNGPDIGRITRYHLYWNFYNGKHWRLYNDTLLSFNYLKAFINKVNSFLLGKEGFSLEVESDTDQPVDDDVESAGEAIINAVWKANKKVLLQYEILQMGSITGDVWLHPQYRVDEFNESYISIECPDSRHCFPEFENGDTTKLASFMFRIPLIKNQNEYKLLVKKYTATKIYTWYQKDTNTVEEDTVKFGQTTEDNPYKFIPVVHIKNRPKADDYYGSSDMVDILKINKIYNEVGQTLKEIVEYYATPTTVITGGSVKSLTKGIGRLWSGLPAEANVFNLSLGEDLNGAMIFWDKLKVSMHELSDVPENALGKLQAISNTSAAALQITYQPLIQQADSKAISYSEGFKKLHKMIIKMKRVVEPADPMLAKLPTNFENKFSVKPVFTYGLPSDRSAELNNGEVEIRTNLTSRRALMNRLGVKNVPAMMAEIDAEKIKDADTQAAVNKKLGVVLPGSDPSKNQAQ